LAKTGDSKGQDDDYGDIKGCPGEPIKGGL